MLRGLIFGFGLMGLIGCQAIKGEKAWFRDQAKDYHYSYQSDGLKIPTGLSVEPRDEHYHIEPLNKADLAEIDLIPPGIF